MPVNITYATEAEYEYLVEHDQDVSGEVIRRKIGQREFILAWEAGKPVGWLRFNYFWDTVPFMTMLFIEEPYRGKGYASEMIRFWEEELRGQRYQRVMTSTMSNETAQHLYRKLGYRDCGAVVLPDEALELILMKELGKRE
jgi:ribosomal protein S18 acetylase RimI-like enzyme